MTRPRLAPGVLRDHLLMESPATARLVRETRRTVLRVASGAAEALKFGVLCYFRADAWFGSIGGNICMIEIKPGGRNLHAPRRVLLSFIHGALLPDPAGLLRGTGKSKRFIPIPDAQFLKRREVLALLRAARDLRPWD